MDTNIKIPKGCQCVDVDIGEYTNQVVLPTPDHMLKLGGDGWYEYRPKTCVDRCLEPLIKELWAKGVITTGCCCGHNKVNGYIGIHLPDDIEIGKP
jgi:hypothetical protein